MPSPALDVFERLEAQVTKIRGAAGREVEAGEQASGPILLRACIVLTVAAFDTYGHEQGVRLLGTRALVGPQEADDVARYLGQITAQDVTGVYAQGLIRYRLSYRTLVAPPKIDELFVAAGLDAQDLWLKAAIGNGSRPDRMRMQVQLQYDRRNQIAHEGDWDTVALDFRHVEDAHVNDCSRYVREAVTQFDTLLP